jgi:hydrogenase maturation protease
MLELRNQLRRCFEGRCCLMGLGNVDHGDDGLGVRLAEELVQAGIPNVIVAGLAPERFIMRVLASDFDHLTFLDAVDLGREPGTVAFLDGHEMVARFPQISTHRIALGVLAKSIEAEGRGRAWLVGIQPESLKPSKELSPRVRRSFEVLRQVLMELSMPSGAALAPEYP